MDQRGCGKSSPIGATEENTTWDLVEDIETLRKLLKIEKWTILGGSWGSTLALSYAIRYPQRVQELILRGIFLGRKTDLDWFFKGSIGLIFPDLWNRFLGILDEEERKDPLESYHRIFHGQDPRAKAAAEIWSCYEGSLLYSMPKKDAGKDFASGKSWALARLESHYFVNGCFFPEDDYLCKQAGIHLQSIKTTIVHGRYDMVCPLDNAWKLHQVLPKSKLIVVEGEGHSGFEPGIFGAVCSALDQIG